MDLVSPLAYSFALRSQAEQALSVLAQAGVDSSRTSFVRSGETGLSEAVLEDTRFFARDRRAWLEPRQAAYLGAAIGAGAVLAAASGMIPLWQLLPPMVGAGALFAYFLRGKPAEQARMASLFLQRGDLVVLVHPHSAEERERAMTILEAAGGHPREAPP